MNGAYQHRSFDWIVEAQRSSELVISRIVHDFLDLIAKFGFQLGSFLWKTNSIPTRLHPRPQHGHLLVELDDIATWIATIPSILGGTARTVVFRMLPEIALSPHRLSGDDRIPVLHSKDVRIYLTEPELGHEVMDLLDHDSTITFVRLTPPHLHPPFRNDDVVTKDTLESRQLVLFPPLVIHRHRQPASIMSSQTPGHPWIIDDSIHVLIHHLGQNGDRLPDMRWRHVFVGGQKNSEGHGYLHESNFLQGLPLSHGQGPTGIIGIGDMECAVARIGDDTGPGGMATGYEGEEDHRQYRDQTVPESIHDQIPIVLQRPYANLRIGKWMLECLSDDSADPIFIQIDRCRDDDDQTPLLVEGGIDHTKLGTSNSIQYGVTL